MAGKHTHAHRHTHTHTRIDVTTRLGDKEQRSGNLTHSLRQRDKTHSPPEPHARTPSLLCASVTPGFAHAVVRVHNAKPTPPQPAPHPPKKRNILLHFNLDFSLKQQTLEWVPCAEVRDEFSVPVCGCLRVGESYGCLRSRVESWTVGNSFWVSSATTVWPTRFPNAGLKQHKRALEGINAVWLKQRQIEAKFTLQHYWAFWTSHKPSKHLTTPQEDSFFI